MRTILPLLSVVFLTAGCKKSVDVPKNIDKLLPFLYANYENEDGLELIEGAETLRAELKKFDLTGDAKDRTFREISPLTPADWGEIKGPKSEDPADQVPRAIAGQSSHPIADHRELVSETNWVCIDSETVKYSQREFITDIDCYVDGDCDAVEVVNETRRESFLADVTYDYLKHYRMVELDDGTQVMYAKGWAEQVWEADGGTNSWDQQYGIEVWIENGNKTDRFQVFWSAVTLKGLPTSTYTSLVESGLEEGFVFGDAWLSGEKDYCGNDRSYVPE